MFDVSLNQSVNPKLPYCLYTGQHRNNTFVSLQKDDEGNKSQENIGDKQQNVCDNVDGANQVLNTKGIHKIKRR